MKNFPHWTSFSFKKPKSDSNHNFKNHIRWIAEISTQVNKFTPMCYSSELKKKIWHSSKHRMKFKRVSYRTKVMILLVFLSQLLANKKINFKALRYFNRHCTRYKEFNFRPFAMEPNQPRSAPTNENPIAKPMLAWLQSEFIAQGFARDDEWIRKRRWRRQEARI